MARSVVIDSWSEDDGAASGSEYEDLPGPRYPPHMAQQQAPPPPPRAAAPPPFEPMLAIVAEDDGDGEEPTYEDGDTETPVLSDLAERIKTMPDLLMNRTNIITALRQRPAVDDKSTAKADELIQPLFKAPEDAKRTARERAGQHWTVWTHFSAFCSRPDVAISPWPISPLAVALFLHDKTQTGRGDSKGTLLVYRNALTNVQKASASAFSIQQPPAMLRKSEVVQAAIDSGRKPATGARGKRARKDDDEGESVTNASVPVGAAGQLPPAMLAAAVNATLDPALALPPSLQTPLNAEAGPSTSIISGGTAPPPKKRNRNNPAGSAYGTSQPKAGRPKNPLNMPLGPESTELDKMRARIRTVPDFLTERNAVLNALKMEPEDAEATEKSETIMRSLYATGKENADKKVRQTMLRYSKFCDDTGIHAFPVEPLRITLFLLNVSPLEKPTSSTTLIRYRTHLNRLRVATEHLWPAERDGLSSLRTPLVAAVVATGRAMVSRPNKDVKDEDAEDEPAQDEAPPMPQQPVPTMLRAHGDADNDAVASLLTIGGSS